VNTQLTHAAASTMPPLKPTAEDLVLLAGAQEAELAARDLYDAGIAAASWTEEQATLMVALRESHEAYAQSLSAMLGVKGSGVASADITAANEVGMPRSSSPRWWLPTSVSSPSSRRSTPPRSSPRS
jgi:hypothetical protein